MYHSLLLSGLLPAAATPSSAASDWIYNVMHYSVWRSLFGWFLATVLPVPVIQLNLDGQLLQGDVAVVPEGDLHHLSDQLVQLALQLLDDGQVVRVLRILGLKLLQIVVYRLVQWGCTVIYLDGDGGQTRSWRSWSKRRFTSSGRGMLVAEGAMNY